MTFKTIWTGYGKVEEDDDTWVLAPKVATSINETHSCLVLSEENYTDKVLRAELLTTEQLREGDPPNTWEVAWLIFSAKDERYFWYTMLKPNGVEVGIFDHDDQYFLLTENRPTLEIGKPNIFEIKFRPQAVHLKIDKSPKMVIPKTPPVGRIGWYTEDAVTQFKLL